MNSQLSAVVLEPDQIGNGDVLETGALDLFRERDRDVTNRHEHDGHGGVVDRAVPERPELGDVVWVGNEPEIPATDAQHQRARKREGPRVTLEREGHGGVRSVQLPRRQADQIALRLIVPPLPAGRSLPVGQLEVHRIAGDPVVEAPRPQTRRGVVGGMGRQTNRRADGEYAHELRKCSHRDLHHQMMPERRSLRICSRLMLSNPCRFMSRIRSVVTSFSRNTMASRTPARSAPAPASLRASNVGAATPW